MWQIFLRIGIYTYMYMCLSRSSVFPCDVQVIYKIITIERGGETEGGGKKRGFQLSREIVKRSKPKSLVFNACLCV